MDEGIASSCLIGPAKARAIEANRRWAASKVVIVSRITWAHKLRVLKNRVASPIGTYVLSRIGDLSRLPVSGTCAETPRGGRPAGVGGDEYRSREFW